MSKSVNLAFSQMRPIKTTMSKTPQVDPPHRETRKNVRRKEETKSSFLMKESWHLKNYIKWTQVRRRKTQRICITHQKVPSSQTQPLECPWPTNHKVQKTRNHAKGGLTPLTKTKRQACIKMLTCTVIRKHVKTTTKVRLPHSKMYTTTTTIRNW